MQVKKNKNIKCIHTSHTNTAKRRVRIYTRTTCENARQILYNGIYVMLFAVLVRTCVQRKRQQQQNKPKQRRFFFWLQGNCIGKEIEHLQCYFCSLKLTDFILLKAYIRIDKKFASLDGVKRKKSATRSRKNL